MRTQLTRTRMSIMPPARSAVALGTCVAFITSTTVPLASALTLYHPGRRGRCPVVLLLPHRRAPSECGGPGSGSRFPLGSVVLGPSPGPHPPGGACWHLERAFVAPGPRLRVGSESVPGAAGSPPASYAQGRPAGKPPGPARAAASTRQRASADVTCGAKPKAALPRSRHLPAALTILPGCR